MKGEWSFPSADGVTEIYVREWIPEKMPKAVLQITHGMVEYVERYSAFAEYLALQGFYVVGQDILGHGHSVVQEEDLGYFAEKEGNQCNLRDMRTLYLKTRETYGGIPYFILGHSMGSFLVRQYIQNYEDDFAGVLLLGTAQQPVAKVAFGLCLTRILSALLGERYRSKLMHALALDVYNRKIENARTSVDWISSDEEIVDAYIKDPWCTFRFTLNAYYQMFLSMKALTAKSAKKVPPEMPILIMSGQMDPVGDYGRQIKKLVRLYRKSGHKNITVKSYPSDRHELLNEKDRSRVYADICRWMGHWMRF